MIKFADSRRSACSRDKFAPYCGMAFTSDRIPPQSARTLPWLVAVAFFMQMLDGTILNTALPGMARELGVAPLRMQSVVIAYMLTTALLMPASGWMADRFGTRLTFVFSVLLFTAGSLLCALSTSLEFLVLSRVVQGVGGALMVPIGRLAVMKAYPRHELVRVLSFVTIPGLLGPLMGPTLGGFLVQYASWHWIFLINIPVGLVGGALAFRCMPDLKATQYSRFDFLGFVLFGLSMVLVSIAMEGFGELHLPKVQASLLCFGGLLFLSLYWLRSVHIPDPLFRPGLFRTRSFSVGILGNLFARLGSGAFPFLMPLFLQLALGFSPFTAGLTMIPSALAGIAGKQMITPLVNKFGLRRFLVVNTAAVGGLIASFGLVGHGTPEVVLVVHLAVFGVFNSMQFTAMNTVTLIDLSDKDAGSGNSLLSVTMQISAVTGVALAGALLSGLSQALGIVPGGLEYVSVFHWTFLLVGAVTLGSALIFAHTPEDAGKGPPEAVQDKAGTPPPQAAPTQNG